jgi:hypothetical protein
VPASSRVAVGARKNLKTNRNTGVDECRNSLSESAESRPPPLSTAWRLEPGRAEGQPEWQLHTNGEWTAEAIGERNGCGPRSETVRDFAKASSSY